MLNVRKLSNLKRGMHFRSFIYIYWHANTDLDFFFKKGSLYWEKDRWKKKPVLLTYTLLMCMNTKIRQTYYSFSLLYFIFFWGLFVLLCFILKFEGEYIPYTPPPPGSANATLNLSRWSNCLLLEQHYINGISYEHLLQIWIYNFLLSTVLVCVMVCK